MDWATELNKMLNVFEHQAIETLDSIKLAFQSNGIPFFTSTFKEYFLRASTIRLLETFDRYEIKSKMEDEMLYESINEENEMESVYTFNQSNEEATARNQQSISDFVNLDSRSRMLVRNARLDIANRNNSNGFGSMGMAYASDPDIQIDDSDDKEAVVRAVETEPIDYTTSVGDFASPYEIEGGRIFNQTTSHANDSNDGLAATNDLYRINESIAHQLDANEYRTMDPEVGSGMDFILDVNETIEMLENGSGSTDADGNDLIPVNVILKRLDEATIAELARSEMRTTSLHLIDPDGKLIMEGREMRQDRENVVNKDEQSVLRQSLPKNRERCTICGYSCAYMGNIIRHGRTHTGQKPYRCDQCGKAFASAANLVKHSASHIEDVPFHCRACFRGFSSKANALAHEKHCQVRHFECHICKKFITCVKTQMVRHMRTHTGIKKFRCEICMKRFGWESGLKQHMNNAHTYVIPCA